MTTYLRTYMHSYIHVMHTYVIHHVIVQCIVIASILYSYNYLPSHYLYVTSSVIEKLFTLFSWLSIYQNSVRNRTITEVNSQFFQFVSFGPKTINYYNYYYCSVIYAWTSTWLCSPQASNNNNDNNMEKWAIPIMNHYRGSWCCYIIGMYINAQINDKKFTYRPIS